MADVPSGDGTADTAHMADLALNLADQLISAFQQVADGEGEEGEGGGAQEDGTPPSDNGGVVDLELDARDGNDEWQDLPDDDELTESCDNGVKEEGVGEENPVSCFSPLGSHMSGGDATMMDQENQDEDEEDVMFSPARMLNFDDSDGDDLPAVDQRFLQRGVFVQPDAMDDRPELHGSEEAGYFSRPPRSNMMHSDYSQNVRIIEGHDDLDLDRGAGYMSLTMRNHFLQTQMVQLPPFGGDDQNASAHLYDSLEREEEEELYPEEDQVQEPDEDRAGLYGKDDVDRDDLSDHRNVDLMSLDHVHFVQEDPMACGAGHSSQQLSRAVERKDQDPSPFHDDGEVAGAAQLNFMAHVSQDREPESEEALIRSDNPGLAGHVHQSLNDPPQGAGSMLVVTLPKQSNSGVNQTQDSGDGAHTNKGENPQQLSARPKQALNKQRQPRGGPAGSNGREVHSSGNRSQAGVCARPTDQRVAPNNRAGSRVAVGLSRQQASGAHSQRPAVQGAAVSVAGISGGGDGDGAVAGSGSNVATTAAALAPPNSGAVAAATAAGSVGGGGGGSLLSRTSSQGSLHSTTSSMSNSRVSGVGKESNNTRGFSQPRPSSTTSTTTRTYASIPGSQDPAAAGSRAAPTAQPSRRGGPNHPQPPPQRPPPPHRPHQAKTQGAPPPPSSGSGNGPQPSKASKPPGSERSPPPSKQKGGGASSANGPPPRAGTNSRSAAQQLQQQQQQLQQEQHHLLHKQRQLQQQQLNFGGGGGGGGGGLESPDGDHLMHNQPEAVLTQVGHIMHQESLRQDRGSVGVNMTTEVQGMEEVRSALQSMLRLPREPPGFDQRSFDFAESASDLLMDRPPTHYQHEMDASSLSGFRGQGPEDAGEMYESFPSFSFKMFSSDMSSLSAATERSMHGENAYLREHLEKERYRRKHCEQQIQSLNAKLLEIQQQLAVAVSTDKRKDIMIDQLDKQLAKVVEGWKKREAEKDEYMSMMMKEKSQIEETLQKQQSMIDSFEKELAGTVEELKQEKENSAAVLDNMKEQLACAVHKQHHAEEVLMGEKERVTLMEKEWDQLKEARDLGEKRAQQAQDRLHQEQDSWYQREQELVHKIDQVKEANLKVMQMERVKLEEQTKKAEELEDILHTTSTEVKRLEMELDSAMREKESLKVEMALKEAKFESAQRTLQAELQATMEKEVTEQVSAVQRRWRQEQEEQGERHRQAVQDLHQRQQRDLDLQMTSLRQDLGRREDDLKTQLAEADTRMNEYRQEISALKQAKQKLESQRLEVLNKLQIIMQSQWNEAVSLLVTTPQRKTLNTSLSSSLGGGGGMFSGGGMGQLSGSTSSAAPTPHFNILSSGQSSALPPSAAGTDRSSSHAHQQRRSGESSPRNNLSDSQSPHSSPTSPAHPRSGSTSGAPTTTTTTRGPPPPPPQKQGSSSSGGGLGQSSFLAESGGVTLQDLTALLSEGHYLPSSVTSGIHGVTHHAGVVVSAHHQQSSASLHQHHMVRQPPPSESQAFMIRPPQQSSRSSGGGSVPDEELRFMSDISHASNSDFSLALQGRGFQHGEREGGGGMSVDSHNYHRQRAPQHSFSAASERGLELRDLEVNSQSSGLSGEMLMVGGPGVQGGRGRVNTMGLPPITAYPPSMSPPVKQGRDGEQDSVASVDGSMLHDTDRLNSSYREISRQLEEHQSRQRELQHYIKMLLDKPPGPGSDQPERDSIIDPDAMDISFGSVAAELGLSEAAQAAQLNSELQRLQQLRDRQATADPPSQSARPRSGEGSRRPDNASRFPSAQPRSGGATAAAQPPGMGGVLAPEQVAEISRLLGQYREDVEASQVGLSSLSSLQADPSSMAQILRFLASLPQHQQGGGEGEQVSSTKSSPRQQSARHSREQQRYPRHHSVGPDTSLSSGSVTTTERQDKSMASSTRSTTTASRKAADRKPVNVVPHASSSSAVSTSGGKSGARPHGGKEQHPPVWK